MVSRRRFLQAAGASALWVPMAAEGQARPRIGYLSIGAASDPRRVALLSAFQQALRDVGYVGDKSLVVEVRFAEGHYDRLVELAAELARLKVDVIVAYSTPAALAAQKATATIPIVMSTVVDPVATKLVAGLGRPGRNITGLSLMAPEMIGKQLQLLKELVPRVVRVAVLWNPANPSNAPQFQEAERSAPTLGLRLQSLEARRPEEIERALATVTRERADGLIVVVEGVFIDSRMQITRWAERTRVPAIYGLREYIDAGGLMFYGANPADLNRRAAIFVDKILKGAKPAGMPVEQPTKFELVINLKTASALGLTVPHSLLVRADHIVE